MSFIIEKIVKFFKSTVGKVIIGILAAIGVGGAANGTVKLAKAKKVNEKALAIRNEAVCRYEEKEKLTSEALEKLGTKESQIISTFKDFSDIIEKIQNRPDFKKTQIGRHKLPELNMDDIKKLSQELEFAFKGLIGAGAGAGIGLAICGLNIFMAGPALFAAGVILTIDGKKITEKAADNVRQAKQIEKQVDDLVDYFESIIESANKLIEIIENVSRPYFAHMNMVYNIVQEKTLWKEFTKEEKKQVENLIILCQILYKVCNTQLVIDSVDKNGDAVKEFNKKGVNSTLATVEKNFKSFEEENRIAS